MTGYNLSMPELITLVNKDHKVNQALNLYTNQILKHIGDSIGMLGGFDTLIFAGRYVKAFNQVIFDLLKTISCMGLSLREYPWDYKVDLLRISSDNSARQVYINNLKESDIIHMETRRILGNTHQLIAP